MSLDELTRIVPPPSAPVAAGTPEQWPLVEKRLGTVLPQDYKQFINLYGRVSFFGFLSVVTPFAPDDRLTRIDQADLLSRWAKTEGASYAAQKHSFGKTAPQEFPFGVYPEPGGLLAMGGWEYGGTLFWHTDGEPDQWSVVAYAEDFFEFKQYPMSLTGFLAQWLAGTLEPEFFDEGLLERAVPIIGPQPFTKPA